MTSWVNQLTHLSFCLFFPCSSSRITDCNVQSSEWILSNLRTNTAAMSDFSFGEHLFQSYHGKFFPDSQFSCIFIYYLIILAFQYNSRISSKGFFDCVFCSWFFQKLHASMHETCGVGSGICHSVYVKIENYFF